MTDDDREFEMFLRRRNAKAASRHSWTSIAIAACAALGGTALLGVPLYFAPGWANGWPAGLTIHEVWSTGMAIWLFVFAETLAGAIGAFINAYAAHFEWVRRNGTRAWVALLVVIAFLAFAKGDRIYSKLKATTFIMWPNGYNP